jgi:hypothetical protein
MFRRPTGKTERLPGNCQLCFNMAEIFTQGMYQNGAYSCTKKSEMVQLCTAAEMPHGFIAFRGSIFKSLILNS